MRYARVRTLDVANGPGVRTSLFTQGCFFRCEGCQNPETHDYKGGLEWTDAVKTNLLDSLEPSHIAGLSILGGEALSGVNISALKALLTDFRERYGATKTVWVWTGHLYEDLIKDANWTWLFEYIDVMVDGQYDPKLYSWDLYMRGSSNQRILSISKSKEAGEAVELSELY